MLNQAGRAATKKLKMLDTVVSHIHKLVTFNLPYVSCMVEASLMILAPSCNY